MSDNFFQSSLITGASSGLGAAFARHLAKPGSHLVLVARRSDRLNILSKELEKLGATVEPLVADLATEQGIQTIVKKITALPNLDLLINNAGFGVVGPFAKEPLSIQADLLRVHNEAPMRLIMQPCRRCYLVKKEPSSTLHPPRLMRTMGKTRCIAPPRLFWLHSAIPSTKNYGARG